MPQFHRQHQALDALLHPDLVAAIELGQLRNFQLFCGLPPVHHWQTEIAPPEAPTLNRLLALTQCTPLHGDARRLFLIQIKHVLTAYDCSWHWMEAGRIEGIQNAVKTHSHRPFLEYVASKRAQHFQLLETYLLLTQQHALPTGQQLRSLALHAAAGAHLLALCGEHAFAVNNRWKAPYTACFPWLQPNSGWTHNERVNTLYNTGETLLETAFTLARNTNSPALEELLLEWLQAKRQTVPWKR